MNLAVDLYAAAGVMLLSAAAGVVGFVGWATAPTTRSKTVFRDIAIGGSSAAVMALAVVVAENGGIGAPMTTPESTTPTSGVYGRRRVLR